MDVSGESLGERLVDSPREGLVGWSAVGCALGRGGHNVRTRLQLLIEQNDEWLAGRHYLSEGSMRWCSAAAQARGHHRAQSDRGRLLVRVLARSS